MRALACLLVLTAGCQLGDSVPMDLGVGDLPPPFVANCTVTAPTAEALIAAGRQSDGSVILPGGRKLTPAGRILDVGGFPLAMRLFPGERYLLVTDGAYGDEALRIVDLQASDPAKAVVWQADYQRTNSSALDPSLFYGLALGAQGKRVFVSDGGHDPVSSRRPPSEHYNVVEVYDYVDGTGGAPPSLKRNDKLEIDLFFSGGDARLPAGLALSSDEKLLYVATQYDGSLAIVDVEVMPDGSKGPTFGQEIGRAKLPGISPYDVAVDEASHTAFVSLWDGKKLGDDQYIDGLAVVDVSDPRHPVSATNPLPTGKAAEAELLLGGKLYVTNADADTISVVDVASHAVKSYPVGAAAALGASPNHVAIEASRPPPMAQSGRIYIANAGENAVVALDAQTFSVLGRIPTAWYPSAVSVLSDGTLLIASAKGLGGFPTKSGFSDTGYMQGVLQIVPRPSDDDLRASDAIVATNLARPRALQPVVTCPTGVPPSFPLPVETPARVPSPIEHVFFVVKENKTYDAILGDLAGGNGDPSLVLFGERITPNTHALARNFAIIDNFYLQAEQSLQGHVWTTSCATNDYTEKAWLTTWGRAYRPLTAFGFTGGLYERLAHPPGGTIFTALDAAGIAYHNYGEISNLLGARQSLDPGFPGLAFNTDISDVIKVQYVLDTLASPFHTPEPFTYLLIPNDHTDGTTPGKPTPESMVADNDEALGRLIDGISHSSLWSSSIIFVVEDDISDGGDHVEAHRSLCLAVSPWIKRGSHTGVNYDISSVYRTMELLLGIPPISLYDTHAAAFYELFSTTPDLTPYTFIPRNIEQTLNPMDAPLADESMKIDFSKPDQAPLGRILWKAMKGRDSEPPWRGASWRPERDLDGE